MKKDKVMHILAGFSISILVIYTMRVLGLGMEYLSIIAVLLVGALKDKRMEG